MSVTAGVIGTVIDTFALDWRKVGPETQFFTDLGLDALDLVSLGMRLEQRFEIEIPYEDLISMQTPTQMADYLTPRLPHGKWS